ncbi:MAG: acetyl-CoA carboxylase biotin carboxyl carrier protein subunit [Cytophagaceae bacterium]|nr:acetyl-CoA carboxylase biotin carboxyl carrier protein subunit [Cytophagaceae bacterium]
MLQIKVNKDKVIEFKDENGQIIINNQSLDLDIKTLGTNKFHVLKDHISYNVEIIEYDPIRKKIKLKVNNEILDLEIKNQLDLMLEKMGINQTEGLKIENIKAPMPGLIIDIKVSDGDAINIGDPLLILEAMKMENVIKSPCKGIIRKIKAKKGDSVEKNQILIEL